MDDNNLSTTTDLDTYASTEDAHRPAVLDTPLSAPIVAALERAWGAVRARHPEVPAVVVVLASGSDGAPAGWLKLGHFAAMRWQAGVDNDRPEKPLMPEVFVGGEGLARGPLGVLNTLLHEAAHALAHTREVKDTSRQGRYHNQRYADLARELGLDVAKIDPIGWSNTSVTDQTAELYAATLADLGATLTIYRHSENTTFGTGSDPDEGGDATRRPRTPRNPGGRTSQNNGTSCLCSCGRRIRVAPSVLDLGPIVCAVCGNPFTSSE